MVEFEIPLDDSEIESFLQQIRVLKTEPSVKFLKQIINGIVEHVPFQNLTMLTAPRRRPSVETIKFEMLNGLGGLCTARNPFLHELLRHLGFEPRFVSSTMGEPDCHISLIVKIDNEDWWADVGNGYPYFEPVKLGDGKIHSNWFFSYRVVNKSNRWEVQHGSTSDWTLNHFFTDEGVDFSRFDRMHDLHYTVPGWGPFLTGLRVNRFWSDGGAILRDMRATSPHGEEFLNSPKEIMDWLKTWFSSRFFENVDVSTAFESWQSVKMESKK